MTESRELISTNLLFLFEQKNNCSLDLTLFRIIFLFEIKVLTVYDENTIYTFDSFKNQVWG